VKFYADSNANYVSELAILKDTTSKIAKKRASDNYLWRYLIALVLLFLILYVIERKFLLLNKLRTIADRYIKEKIEFKENSEETYFKKFEVECRGENLQLIKLSFSTWLNRLSVNEQNFTAKRIAELTDNDELFQYSKQLDEILFGKKISSNYINRWDSKKFYYLVRKSRTIFLKNEKKHKIKPIIPSLNPLN